MRFRVSVLFALLSGTPLVAALPVHAQQLIANGDFETGTTSGFSFANQDNGSFVLLAPGSDTPAVAPDNSTFQTAANSGGGSYFAVTASGAPGTHAMLQNFVVPTQAAGLHLSFQMFVNDQSESGPIIDSSGLDNRTGGIAIPRDNQHARVDILKIGAGDFSTSAADVVDNLYLGVDDPGNGTPEPYTNYSFDLTNVLTPGSAYRLRFAETDNLGSINLGVDNISLVATPEPGSFALLLGMAVTGAGFACKRRRHR